MPLRKKTWPRRDPRKLARLVVILLWVNIGLLAVNGAAMAIEVFYLRQSDPTIPSPFGSVLPIPMWLELVVGASGLLYFGAFVWAAITAAVWIYRVNANSHTLADGMTSSPPWSVGWYFIPFANLWKPFEAMEEAWQVSHSPKSWRSIPTPPLLRWWWGCWLVSGVLGNLSFQMFRRASNIGEVTISEGVGAASALATIIATVVFIKVIERLTAAQGAALDRSAGIPAEPQPSAASSPWS